MGTSKQFLIGFLCIMFGRGAVIVLTPTDWGMKPGDPIIDADTKK